MNENNEPKMSLREAIVQGFAREENDPNAVVDPNASAMQAENGEQISADGMTAQSAEMPASPASDAAASDPSAQAAPANAPSVAPAAQVTPVQQAAPDNTQALIQALIAQNQQLAAQLSQAQGTVQQQSQAAEAAIDQSMTQPSVTIPVLDVRGMQYDDDETIARKTEEWQEAMIKNITDSVAAQYASQLAPIREDWEAKRRIADREAAKSQLYADERFSDFRDRDTQIENILQSTPELDGIEAGRRYLIAGLIARGLSYRAQPSAEEIVKLYESSPDAQRMIDAARARKIADRNGQIPTVIPSTGFSSANAVPDQSPKTKEDLHKRINDRWRL